ncbi:hypothetical protein [Roseibium sp.]|uniref:hypothetical protein n=1 Tax=Roseibium sp. TaxID=1936156 RepID=UPI003BA9D13F
MYIALGFCAAGLIGLAILPAFYRRASRLTEEALRAVNPSSYAEVRAAQDQARARHAIELRRVERQLDGERAKAAKHHLEVSRLRTEIDGLNRGHKAQVSGLETRLGELHGDQKAVDLLSSEVKALKEKLAETESALAESWKTQAPEAAAQEFEDTSGQGTDWLPAAGTMALAQITGLEAEVATLKSRLSKYEPVGSLQADTTENSPHISRLAELEAQLVDTESKYVTAQAEVTRLSLLLDAGQPLDPPGQPEESGAPSGEQLEEIDELKRVNVQQKAELVAKDRSLDRMAGQLEKLRSDLVQAPGLMDLRQEFKALAARLAGTATNQASAGTGPDAQDATAGSSDETGKNRTRQVVVANSKSTKPRSIKVRATKIAPGKKTEDASSAKSSEIATAAEALVSRIVASNRKKDTQEKDAASELAPDTDSKADTTPETDPEDRPTKQNKKDVA